MVQVTISQPLSLAEDLYKRKAFCIATQFAITVDGTLRLSCSAGLFQKDTSSVSCWSQSLA